MLPVPSDMGYVEVGAVRQQLDEAGAVLVREQPALRVRLGQRQRERQLVQVAQHVDPTDGKHYSSQIE